MFSTKNNKKILILESKADNLSEALVNMKRCFKQNKALHHPKHTTNENILKLPGPRKLP